MKTCNSLRSALLILVVLLAALPSVAQTKDEKKAEAQLRIVHGLVGDKDENPVPSSVVYLLNVKTQAVKLLLPTIRASIVSADSILMLITKFTLSTKISHLLLELFRVLIPAAILKST